MDGFTLVELLVAAAIMVIFVVLVALMVQSVATGTSSSSRHIDADDEIRTAFDRMRDDIATMVQRPDVNPRWIPTNGNDAFYFLSQAPAAFSNTSNSGVALIGYVVGTNGLQRLGQGLGWDDPLLQFTNGAIATNASSTNFVSIAPSVFRMEYALLMKPGTYVTSSGASYYTNIIGTNVFLQTNFPGSGMKDVAGIVVSLAILDQTSQKIIPTNVLIDSSLLGAFPDATNTLVSAGTSTNNGSSSDGIPMTSWSAAYLSNVIIQKIPQAASRSQIRVYQRYFPIRQ
jgi:hypothetical protein